MILLYRQKLESVGYTPVSEDGIILYTSICFDTIPACDGDTVHKKMYKCKNGSIQPSPGCLFLSVDAVQWDFG